MPLNTMYFLTISLQELSHDHLVGSPLSSSSSTLSLSPYVAPMPTANPTYNFALAGHTQLTFKDVMGKGNEGKCTHVCFVCCPYLGSCVYSTYNLWLSIMHIYRHFIFIILKTLIGTEMTIVFCLWLKSLSVVSWISPYMVKDLYCVLRSCPLDHKVLSWVQLDMLHCLNSGWTTADRHLV